ncbi:MAG TPA: hypothetical protein IAC37_12595 [Candidatus Ventrimonas merdavium]|nr:hypothetical protein [Candidatus Ventrimonas merdavium]
MSEETSGGIRLTDFDYMVAEPRLQMMKAAIPYMPVPQQRLLSMMIKMQELTRTWTIFSESPVSAMGLSSGAQKPASPIEMLQAMKPYAGPRERELIEMMENIQLMMQTMQTP